MLYSGQVGDEGVRNATEARLTTHLGKTQPGHNVAFLSLDQTYIGLSSLLSGGLSIVGSSLHTSQVVG